IAHALAHHASERLADRGMLEAALRYANGSTETGPHSRNQIVDILAGLGGLRHARAQESEADHIGLFLMTFADYNPDQAVVFWRRMQEATARLPRPPVILSDHPSDAQRIKQMQQWVPMARAAKKAYDAGYIARDGG